MSFISGVGDFFRGAFGENEEEKKRRKQREAQEAAQRKAARVQPKPQATTQPQQPQQQVKNIQDLFGKPKPDPIGVTQKLQNKPLPVIAPPALTKPLPDQQFVGISEGEGKNKTIFGKNAAWLLPHNSVVSVPEQTHEVKADREITTNKDKFVAQFDKLHPDYQKVLVNKAVEDAKHGNQAALNTLNALRESGRMVGGASDFVAGANERLGGGLARSGLRLADFVLPGKNTFGMERLADQQDPEKNKTKEFSDSGKAGETFGTVEKGIVDLAALALPVGEVDKVMKGAKLVKTLEDGTLIMKVGGTLLKIAPGSLVGTGIADAQQRGAGEKPSLAKSAGIGLGIDLAVSAAPAVLRKPFSKLFRGRSGQVAEEAAGVTTTAFSKADPEVRQAIEEAITDKTPSFLKKEVAQEVGEDVAKVADDVPTQAEKDLEVLANDTEAPAYQRKQAQEELDNIKKTKAVGEVKADPANKPAFQHKQEVAAVVKQEEDHFNNFIVNHPELTRQQVEAAQQAAQERVIKLVKDLQDSRVAAIEAVGKQGDALAEGATKQAATAEEVATQQAAQATPAPADVGGAPNAPAATSPEVAANDAYRPSTEDLLYDSTKNFEDKGRLSLSQRFSPDRIWRENIAQPIQEKANQAVNALQTSENRAARGVGRLFTGFSREAGVSSDLLTAKMKLRGGVQTGKLQRESIADLAKGHDDNALTRIWATLDPEHAARAGVNAGEVALSPEETVLRDKLKTIIDNTTEENLRRGLITPEQAASESYLKRAYTVFDGNTEASKFEGGFRQELLGQFKGRKQVTDEMVQEAIKDPTYLVGKKTAESNAIWAMQDYGSHLSTTGVASDVARPGFVQLPDSPVFGDAAAKFVPQSVAEDFTGFQYSHAMTNAFNDLVTAYDRLGVRQMKKQLLTIFNPAVRLGNQMTNRVVFSQLAGINPLQFNAAMFRAGKEIAEKGQLYREAVANGLTGIDISQADFYAQRIAQSTGDKNLAKKAIDWMQTSYSGADDKARVAAYMVQRGRGYSQEEAARLVQHGFQDYKSVGFFYDLAAKTPVIGNAFVRFAADSARIAKNAAVDHPLRTLSTLAAWSAFVNGMSVVSGESTAGNEGDSTQKKALNLITGSAKSENQKAREARFGSPHIPFTNIALAVQTPWGEVNAARFMPWYQLNDINDSGVGKFLPFQSSPVTVADGKVKVNPQAMNDPLLGQVVQLGMDKDFRNKSIQDPNNTEDGSKYSLDPLSGDEKRNNALRFLFDNNAPLGRETDNLLSAYKKDVGGVVGSKEGEDLYGKERTPAQAWLRAGGVKIEQYGDAQVKKQADTEKYFQEKAQIDKEVEGMSPAAQEAYKRLTGYYKLREQVPDEFESGKTRDKKAEVYEFSEDKWKELAAHPELYQLLVDKKQREKASDGKPIQPEYDSRLSEPFRKQIIQNKMVAPGDDAELDQRMYSSPEWDYYQQLKKQYSAEADKYYPDNKNDNFDDETVKHQDAKFPDKPDILKQYGAAYAAYTKGQAAEKPKFTDQLKAAKEAYNKETFNWTNNERKARGLPAIVWEMWNNPTFGYDETPSGFGFGFGGGKSNYDPAMHVNTLGKLTNFSGDIPRLSPQEAAAYPQLAQLFARLQAGSGGGRAKPKLGASATGR